MYRIACDCGHYFSEEGSCWVCWNCGKEIQLLTCPCCGAWVFPPRPGDWAVCGRCNKIFSPISNLEEEGVKCAR